jgi:predicted peroxiredoxin
MLIASRDPFASNDVHYIYDLAADLARAGHRVTLFLVQNGVLPARNGPMSKCLTELSQAGISILADDFSLRERGISNDRVADGVSPAPLDRIIDAMANGDKTIWH